MPIAIDTETFLSTPEEQIPRLVCVSVCSFGYEVLYHANDNPPLADIFSGHEQMVFAFAPFDLAVILRYNPYLQDQIFYALKTGLIKDIQIREKLLAIREGRYEQTKFSLDDLTRKYLGFGLNKGQDSWRLRYSELYPIPLASWPEEARTYAIMDARATLGVYEAQERIIQSNPLPPQEEARQVRADFALHLTAKTRGLRTDPIAVDKLKTDLTNELESLQVDLLAGGIYKQDLVRDTKLIREKVRVAYSSRGLPVPMTEASKRFPNGQIQYSEEVLADSGDPLLEKLAKTSYSSKLLTTYLPILEQRVSVPFGCSYNVLVSTGRTSSFKPNDQNIPRKGGVRECYIPSPGHLFVSADYDTAELRALAQIHLWMFGHSALAEAFKADRDPHLEMAGQLAGIPYEEVVARFAADDATILELRQFSKIANFGYPGGLGPESFVSYAKGVGVTVSLTRSHELREAFFSTWPEMKPYFERVAQATNALEGSGRLIHWVSGRVKGRCSFAQYANNAFQGLIADGAKDALWEVVREWKEHTGPLKDFIPLVFIHDQILGEAPRECAGEVAERLARVMCDVLQRWIPDVPIKASPVLMDRWYKGAKTVRDSKGELLIWKK